MGGTESRYSGAGKLGIVDEPWNCQDVLNDLEGRDHVNSFYLYYIKHCIMFVATDLRKVPTGAGDIAHLNTRHE
jgi:hypothetical protein